MRFTRHFPDKELTVGGGNRQLGRWQHFSILQLLCSSAWDRREPDVMRCVLFQGDGAHVLQARPRNVWEIRNPTLSVPYNLR